MSERPPTPDEVTATEANATSGAKSTGEASPAIETISSGVALPRRLISLGVVAALIVPAAFFVAYMYELGFANAFNIDPGLINVTTSAVARTFYGLTAFIVLIGFLAETTIFGLNEPARFRSRTWLYWLAIVEAIVLACLAYWLAWGFEMSRLVRAGVFALGVSAVWTVIVVVFLARREHSETGWTGMLALLIRSGYYPYVVGAFVAVAFGYWHGAADAALQREFLVSKADRCVVVLREYGDQAIAARRVGFRLIDPQTVIVLRLGDEGAREFERRNVGPLRSARVSAGYNC